MEGHGRIQTVSGNICDDCDATFASIAELDHHALREQHTPHMCKCGKGFSRPDVLDRHVRQHESLRPKYPCPHCSRHRGDKAFRRRDHLTQHTRNYHHIGVDEESKSERSEEPVCPQLDCPQHRSGEWQDIRPISVRDESKPFANQAAFTRHMRDVHRWSPFPCDVPHCSRIDGKGYFRKRDMLKHRKNGHADAPPAVVANVDSTSSDAQSHDL